jgi:hypothetical protein
MMTHQAANNGVDAALHARLHELMDEGWELWSQFDTDVRVKRWHPFVAADYQRVLDALLTLRAPGQRFIELGSATGVITIMADLLGFDAYGVELDASLVDTARALALKYASSARFAAGSFLPAGYRWKSPAPDGRGSVIGDGTSAYPSLGFSLEDFDLVYAYPWPGEDLMMLDLMRGYGRPGARLILHSDEGARTFIDGRLEPLHR